MIEIHTCPDCKYKWRHGQHGGHSCVSRLVEQRADLLEALQAALETAEFEKHADRPWHHDARAAIRKATE